jgi:hypothetical protein
MPSAWVELSPRRQPPERPPEPARRRELRPNSMIAKTMRRIVGLFPSRSPATRTRPQQGPELGSHGPTQRQPADDRQQHEGGSHERRRALDSGRPVARSRLETSLPPSTRRSLESGRESAHPAAGDPTSLLGDMLFSGWQRIVGFVARALPLAYENVSCDISTESARCGVKVLHLRDRPANVSPMDELAVKLHCSSALGNPKPRTRAAL